MMKTAFKYLGIACAAGLLSCCSTGKREAAGAMPVPPEEISPINISAMKPDLIPGSKPAAMPKAILYKTTGDYNNNVPVQLNPDGTLLSYPAPGDIPVDATPVEFNGGWYLSPIGVSSRSVFTTYTYDEYRSLPQAPTPEEILKAVIPGARVTLTYALPMTPQEALADTAAVNRLMGPAPRVKQEQ